MDVSDLERRFSELGDEVEPYSRPGARLRPMVVGGAALMLQGLAAPGRVTEGIDLMEAPFEALPYMGALDMDSAVPALFFKMPSGWRARLVELHVGAPELEVLSPSPADLAIMKLVSARERDIDDVGEMARLRPRTLVEVEKILGDPLEMEVDLEEGEWGDLLETFSEVRDGIEPERLPGAPGEEAGGPRRPRAGGPSPRGGRR